MLSIPWESCKTAYDFIVVGSGYGGAVTAARIAIAPLNPTPVLCILEPVAGPTWRPRT